MEIFRIENPECGNGPYSASGVYHEYWSSSYYNNADKHPTPQEDDMLNDFFNSEYYFGFESIDSLLKWFDQPKHLFALDELGFVIRVYETEVCYVGKSQVIFIKEDSEMVEELALRTVYDHGAVEESIIEEREYYAQN